jgi:hypothetical protein
MIHQPRGHPCLDRRWLIVGQKGFLDMTRLIFIDETAVTINMVRLRRPLAAWRATDQPRSARGMEDHHVSGCAAAQQEGGTDGPRDDCAPDLLFYSQQRIGLP